MASIIGDVKIDLSMSRDQKLMAMLSPMEKCPINFYHGVAFTAQIW